MGCSCQYLHCESCGNGIDGTRKLKQLVVAIANDNKILRDGLLSVRAAVVEYDDPAIPSGVFAGIIYNSKIEADTMKELETEPDIFCKVCGWKDNERVKDLINCYHEVVRVKRQLDKVVKELKLIQGDSGVVISRALIKTVLQET